MTGSAVVTKQERVYQAIRERILSGAYGPGYRVVIDALAEALVLGRNFGLAPSTMVEIVNNSTGRSFSSEVVFAKEVVTGRYGTGFALGLLAKDVTIAAEIADGSGVDAPVCELVQRRWEEAAQALGFAADHSTAHKQWWDVDLTVGAPDGAERSSRSSSG